MFEKLTKKLLLTAATLGLVGAFALTPGVSAIDITEQGSQGDGAKVLAENADNDDFATIVGNVISLLLFILGIAAVVVIIIAGFMYVTSNGDSGKLEQAKNTILYAVVGLLVAIFAYVIVNFAIGIFSSDGS